MWNSIKTRCYNPNYKHFKDYGGRGIFMCEGLRASVQKFKDILGNKPSKECSVDRVDNSKGYLCGDCPECLTNKDKQNIKWATPKEQANNTRRNKKNKPSPSS